MHLWFRSYKLYAQNKRKISDWTKHSCEGYSPRLLVGLVPQVLLFVDHILNHRGSAVCYFKEYFLICHSFRMHLLITPFNLILSHLANCICFKNMGLQYQTPFNLIVVLLQYCKILSNVNSTSRPFTIPKLLK